MSSKNPKPRWWQVYATIALLIALFLGEIRLGLTGALNIVAQLGILLLIYGLIHLWIRANRTALMGMDQDSGQWQFKVYEISSADLQAAAETLRPRPEAETVPLPRREVKGVLDTTFQLDELDGRDAVPADSELFQSDEVHDARSARG